MRITKVYTRQGDQGMTRLGDNSKVSKDHPRVVAYGAVDLANSTLGVARTEIKDPDLDAILEDAQHRLFDVGGLLCVPGAPSPELEALLKERIGALERQMDTWMSLQGPLEEFILPGGTKGAALLHLCRTQIRWAEQLIVTLHRTEPVAPSVLTYVNRLNDALFVMAREVNRRGGVKDVTWKNPKAKPAAKAGF